jgi:hypothetical protein
MFRSIFSRLVLMFAVSLCTSSLLWGGTGNPSYKVLNPISHGNLSIFPVVTSYSHDTSEFITLDEGIRSGEVIVSESGRLPAPLIRGPHVYIPRSSGAQVNHLVLVNNSKHPLILLAGEIVTGGKQDRVVGKDRLIPAESDPVDLSVFCVEPGRWTGSTDQFSTMKSQMAQPSVRREAMVAKNQQMVWDSVASSRDSIAGAVGGPLPAAKATTSYAKTFEDGSVQKVIEAQAAPIEQSYSSLMRQLRDQHAVGVVVAVGGQFIWADIFASTPLLEKYWPKLVRSYAAEAMTTRISAKHLTVAAAQKFLDETQGTHETIESEPGVYSQAEAVAPDFKVFTLSSLLPGTGFDLHISKIADANPQPEVSGLGIR